MFSATDPSLREKCIRISRYQIRQRRKICRNKISTETVVAGWHCQPVYPASVYRFAAIHQACGSNQRNAECRRALPLSPSFTIFCLSCTVQYTYSTYFYLSVTPDSPCPLSLCLFLTLPTSLIYFLVVSVLFYLLPSYTATKDVDSTYIPFTPSPP